jgi:mannose-6-phosphate isomerase
MASVFKLNNTIKHYDWGSPEWIPRLLGRSNEGGKPWAELWMGVHPEGPSALAPLQEPNPSEPLPRLLPELISRNPEQRLGEGIAREFGGLPFLLKLLAAERPLSIQAHPNLAQARAGWERENSLGIPPDAPNRNYRDPNHKPEIICALGDFIALAGFREPGEIRSLLGLFDCPALSPLLEALAESPETGGGEGALKRFLGALFSLGPEARRALSARARDLVQAMPDGGNPEVWELAARFAELYPEDPAIIAPLYLNLITLKNAQAMNIPAGVMHAYVRGFGVELMANSDNVLRGGLTPKHIDVGELTAILRFAPFKPEILEPAGDGGALESYPAPFREFSLHRLQGRGPGLPFPLQGPAIILILKGELNIPGEKLRLRQGESAFVVPAAAPVLSGSYEAVVAAIGRALPANQ